MSHVNAIIAEWMGWVEGADDCGGSIWWSPPGVTDQNGQRWRSDAPNYDSEESPRRLMAEVEACIAEQGLWPAYRVALFAAKPSDLNSDAWAVRWYCMAPASARAAAAAQVIRSTTPALEGIAANSETC